MADVILLRDEYEKYKFDLLEERPVEHQCLLKNLEEWFYRDRVKYE